MRENSHQTAKLTLILRLARTSEPKFGLGIPVKRYENCPVDTVMTTTSARVLLVDDERAIRVSVGARLRQDGHQILQAGSAAAARKFLNETIDVAILDARLPDGSGVDLLRDFAAVDPELPVIMLTGHSSVSHAVDAMRAGAFHYITKPVDLDELARLIERALEMTQLRREVRGLRAERARTSESMIVGRSPEIQKVRELISRIAVSPASTVLLTGESGTGKDLAARAIHHQSDRADGPFLNITCSALPAALLESELFGHERGAFTDAKQRKLGLVEHAEGGTTFLDEIGEMELGLQAKLLRLLESKFMRRVGGSTDIHADTRIVAATNIELREAVRQGKFREDLYYRLAVLVVRLPPLRDRVGDAELLAMHFVARFNSEFGKNVQEIAPGALELVRTYPWPGNVRELKNAIERAVLLAKGNVLTRSDFEMLTSTSVEEHAFRLPAAGVDMRALELSLVKQALARTRGNRTRAAKLLGMNRDQIRYRIENFGLERGNGDRGSA